MCYFLCYCYRMKFTETDGNKNTRRTDAHSTRDAAKYQKVYDGRKRRIRSLWKRGGAFYAQLSLPNEDGIRKVRRVKLDGLTVAAATDEMRRMVIDRNDDQLPAMVRKPKFDDYAQDYIDREYALGRKTDRTLNTESGHINFWRKQFGETRLNKITPKMIQEGLIRKKATGVSPRTLNLSLTTLRNVLRSAIDEGWMVESPARLIKWYKVPIKNRQLFTSEQLELLCESAKKETANHRLFCDFVRFLCFSGARIGEAMPLSWADVDFNAEQVVIGRNGDTKNKGFRVVDFNPSLRAHLQAMRKRRTQELWLFPSAQRGRKGEHSQSIRESLLLARAHAKLDHIRFHDCRHHFISYCVMSGIDFMTIAKWVGHKDGGMLIGRTYGHLANEHTKRAAQKVSFG